MEILNGIGAWLLLILIASFGVIGLIEGVKSVATGLGKNVPVWVLTILSLVLSFISASFLGFVTGTVQFGSTINAILFGGLISFAFIEIAGYNIIVKVLFAAFDALIRWLDGIASSARLQG